MFICKFNHVILIDWISMVECELGFHLFSSQVITSNFMRVFSAFPTRQSVTIILKCYNIMVREFQEHKESFGYVGI